MRLIVVVVVAERGCHYPKLGILALMLVAVLMVVKRLTEVSGCGCYGTDLGVVKEGWRIVACHTFEPKIKFLVVRTETMKMTQ